jgi:DtxR family Mn-dependent transcriptional regulator
LFLVQVLGMDWSEVHAEAERLEHAISERVLERIDDMLGHPAVDPHGDPIPDRSGRLTEQPVETLDRVEIGARLRVVRVLDQSADFLRYVDQQGLRPGAGLVVESRDEAADVLTLAVDGAAGGSVPGQRVRIGLRPAARIFVEPASRPEMAAADAQVAEPKAPISDRSDRSGRPVTRHGT